MNKLFFGFIMSFFVLFVFWFLAGYIEHGEFIFVMHLDLKATFEQISSMDFSISIFDFIDLLEDFQESLNFPDWLQWAEIVLTYSVAPMIFIFKWLQILIVFLRDIITFLLSPKFTM